jgi:type IX secretion system PorP/SprF family membrane protein
MKKLSLIILCTTISLVGFSQQDLMVSQYTFNHAFLNPAATGISGFYNVSVMYRNQWVQFEGAPVSQFLSFDGPVISDKMGLGLLIQNETIGVNKQTDVSANYSYIMDMNRVKLSLGLRGGLTIFDAQYTNHVAWDTDDAILQENTTSYLPNFGFGAYLKHDNYYAGLSIPHLLNYNPQSTLSLDFENSNQAVRHYYLMGGYRIHIGDDFVIEPSVLFKHAEKAPSQLDGNLLLEYKQIFTIGGGYRTGDSFILLSKFQISNKFQLGYSFDVTMTDIKDYSNGSHEIMLNYIFGKEVLDAPSFF